MTLTLYLNQKDPVRVPIVRLKPNEYTVANSGMFGRLRDEKRSRVYINTDNPLLSGVEYCLIGSTFYTTDRDGNPKNRSCFHIEYNE